MIQSKMIEKDEELHCSFNHNLPICAVVLDTKLQKNHTLLCSLCMENIESKAEVISFKKVLKDIEEIQAQKKLLVENVIMINIDQIEIVQKDLILLKSHVIQQLDEIIGGANEWIKQVLIIGQQSVTYSFFNELDNQINEKKLVEFNQKSLIDCISQIKQSYIQKICKKLNLFKQFQESQKCEEMLRNLEKANQIKENIRKCVFIQENDIIQQKEVIKFENQQNQQKQQLIMEQQIELKLIDDSNQQIMRSQAIVFDKTGQIMVSCKEENIIIWNFVNGRLKLSKTYQVHKMNVKCLVYSKNSNNFISGSDDNTIICWQQINQNEWKYSQPFQQHNDKINCLIKIDKKINLYQVGKISQQKFGSQIILKMVQLFFTLQINIVIKFSQPVQINLRLLWHHVAMEYLLYGRKDQKRNGNLNI